MNNLIDVASRVILIGFGATAIMDIWLLLLKALGVPTLNFALIGRWAGHWRHGVWKHKAIATAPAMRGELALGWVVHYAVGIGYAGLAVALFGVEWMHSPNLLPAVAMGMATVAAPWLVMQPAMGAGIAASKTPAPGRNRIRSLVNHTVFGGGLFLSALAVAHLQGAAS